MAAIVPGKRRIKGAVYTRSNFLTTKMKVLKFSKVI
jgi:hypothetical protein